MTKIVVFLSNVLGLWPFDQSKNEFRLFSKMSYVSLVKIAILTMVVPITIYYTGWSQEELDNKKYSTTFNTDEYIGIEGSFVEKLTFAIEFFLNF